MHLRQSILLSLPLLLSSSLALAQQAPASSSTSEQSKKDCDEKKTGQKTESQKAKKGEASTTVLGKKATTEGEDLDVSVSETTTTAAEPPRPDVAESRAEEMREIRGRRWNAAPLVGYGTNDLNLGIGGRVGYTFETPIYVGGTFLYHFGSDNVTTGPGITQSDRRIYYPAAEVGYDLGLGPLVVRPYGGVGIYFTRTSITTNGVSGSDTNSELMMYPGATAQYVFPKSPVFVGADTRVLIPLEGSTASFSLFATAGLTL